MKKIPKLNINYIKNISNNNYLTPKNKRFSHSITNSEKSLFTTFNKLSPNANVITHFSFNFSQTKDSSTNTNYYNSFSKYLKKII